MASGLFMTLAAGSHDAAACLVFWAVKMTGYGPHQCHSLGRFAEQSIYGSGSGRRRIHRGGVDQDYLVSSFFVIFDSKILPLRATRSDGSKHCFASDNTFNHSLLVYFSVECAQYGREGPPLWCHTQGW